jgi:hypothetical protein
MFADFDDIFAQESNYEPVSPSLDSLCGFDGLKSPRSPLPAPAEEKKGAGEVLEPDHSFEFNRKQVFLTYSQCGTLSKESAQRFFERFSKDRSTIAGYIIAEEEHKDGGRHLHVVLQFLNRFHCRHANTFDIEGVHPNIQVVRSLRATCRYARKDGNYIESGTLSCSECPIELARRGDVSAAREAFIAKYPLQYIVRKPQVDQNLRSIATESKALEDPPFSRDSFKVPDAVAEWDRSYRLSKTLVLSGPGSLGKTSLAKALLPGGFFAPSVESIKTCQDFSRGIILDDATFGGWTPALIRNLLDRTEPRALAARYHDVAIPAGVPMIICTNDCKPFDVSCLGLQDFNEYGEAISRRVVLVKLTNKLYE